MWLGLVWMRRAYAQEQPAPPPWTEAVPGGEVLYAALLVILAILAGWVAYRALFAGLRRWARFTASDLDQRIARYARAPFRLLVPLVALGLVLPVLPVEAEVLALVRALHGVLLTGVGVWLAFAAIHVVEGVILARYDLSARDNLTARAVHTQVRVGRNLLSFLAIIMGTGVVLMTIPAVRQLGMSLLASAGVAGVIIGFAAQRSIATLIAGVQIAITQPIRIDDVVIVEGEFGTIEEITLTYVVVRVWDLRRIIVPITQFIEQPFQNWTRRQTQLLGTVFLYTDYRVDVDGVRQELKRILDASDLWDGEAWGLLAVDSTEQTVKLRAVASAANAGEAWALRCHVRERLLSWLQHHHPESLPRLRAVVAPSDPASGRGHPAGGSSGGGSAATDQGGG